MPDPHDPAILAALRLDFAEAIAQDAFDAARFAREFARIFPEPAERRAPE